MADVYVNALTTISTEPGTTDSVVCVNRNTNEGQIIDYNLLADKILEKLTSKQYSALTTTSKLITGAINELDSDVASLNSSLDSKPQNVMGSVTKVTSFPYTPTVNGVMSFQFKITADGAWYAYYSTTGMGYTGWAPQFSGNSRGNYGAFGSFPIKKGATISFQSSSNVTIEAAYFMPIS